MLVAAVITAGLIIWRDRASGPPWHTVTAGLLFALMIAWSGHDDVLIGVAIVLLVVMLALGIITGRLPTPRLSRAKSRSASNTAGMPEPLPKEHGSGRCLRKSAALGGRAVA